MLYIRKMGTLAALAGVLLLMLSLPYAAGECGTDERVWRVLEGVGAEPELGWVEFHLRLEGPSDWERAARVLAPALLPGAEMVARHEGGVRSLVWRARDGRSLTLAWHPLGPEGGQAWRSVGAEPVPQVTRGGQGLVALRLYERGPARPAAVMAALEAWSRGGHVYRVYVGRLPGATDRAHLERKAQELTAQLGARINEKASEDGWVSLAGYGGLLGPGRRTLGGTVVNVQVVLRARPERGDTLVYIGFPLVPAGF